MLSKASPSPAFPDPGRLPSPLRSTLAAVTSGRLVLLVLAALLAAAPGRAVRAQESAARSSRRRAAVDDGLRYLADQQNRDGSFGKDDHGKVGITSLCLLAFMAQGHQEGRGPYSSWTSRRGGTGDVLRRGVNYLLKHSLPPSGNNRYLAQGNKPVGYIWDRDDTDSRMHGHGYATQVLVLAYGAVRKSTPRGNELRMKIQRAVRVIENAQTNTGGWGYEPNHATGHEGSITVTVVQALRLAADAGFVVDRRVHERGLQYLKDSQKSDGSFKYSLTSDTSTAALTAAALTAMHGFGEYFSKSVRSGLEYLDARFRYPRRVRWRHYAHYYAAQVYYRAGGARWRDWEHRVVPLILTRQERAGSWRDDSPTARRGSYGKAYGTAFSVLALSVPDGYLPLFQR